MRARVGTSLLNHTPGLPTFRTPYLDYALTNIPHARTHSAFTLSLFQQDIVRDLGGKRRRREELLLTKKGELSLLLARQARIKGQTERTVENIAAGVHAATEAVCERDVWSTLGFGDYRHGL